MKSGAAAVVMALALVANLPAYAGSCQPDRVVFDGAGGKIEFSVEIADDAAERAQGLMFRREMPAGHGMLFIYETPQPVSFWMRNTLIPLDMVFIDMRGEVRHVHPMARPHDETPIPGATPGDPSPERLMVLEIAGGEAGRLGIAPGMVLSHPGLPQQAALAPCN